MNKEELSSVELPAPATQCVGSDQYPWTVVEIRGNSVYAIRDEFKVVKGSFQTNNAEVEYIPRLNGIRVCFTLRKNGRILPVGASLRDTGGLVIGTRRYYQDPSF